MHNKRALFSDLIKKVKWIKCILGQALRICTGHTAHRGSRCIAQLFRDHGTRRRWGVSSTPRPILPPIKTRCPLYRRLGGPQGRSGQVRKISLPPGFDPRTVQPLASRYIDYANRPTSPIWKNNEITIMIYIVICFKACSSEFFVPFSDVTPRQFGVKINPLLAWTDPLCCKRLRIPEFLDNKQMKVVRLSALRIGQLYPPMR